MGEWIVEDESKNIVRCKDCVFQPGCRIAQYLGNDGYGYCSNGERKDDSSTGDAVPVKNGKWIEVNDDVITGTCSVCGWNAIFAETDVTGMPYCPNCGARMDGEK